MKEISLDELLSQQQQGLFLATVEPVEDQPEDCKLTPWVEGQGCLCSLAVVIPRAAISSVKLTENRHYCCGKLLFVVEINFQQGSSIKLDDLFSQMMKSATSSRQAVHSFPLASGEAQGMVSPRSTLPAPFFSLPSQATFGSGGMGYRASDCPPPNFTIACNGQFYCVPPGSTCCPIGPCTPPYNYCLPCGGSYYCVQQGSTCCGNFICAPGTRCVNEGGQYVCQ